MLISLSGCGYSSRIIAPGGGDLVVHIPLVKTSALDVDVSGLVDGHLRREVARTAGLVLGGEAAAQSVLHAEVVSVQTRLAAFSDPSVRVAQYVAEVRLKGKLVDRADGSVWGTVSAVGRAPYLSRAGRLESLDGAGRIALGSAAEQACQALLRSIFLKRRPVSASAL